MSGFKIAAAQLASVRGDIARNIITHADAMEVAAIHGVSVLVFPELSLTGYEPDLAAELAMTPADSRLASLQTLAQRHQMEIVVGTPLQNGTAKPRLGAMVIGPQGATRTYGKMHLGGDEPDFFTPGHEPLMIATNGHTTGIAICADASRSTHPQTYAEAGANIYAAGVFLTAEWYATDAPRLASYASRYRMLVVMASHAASVGTFPSVGRSAIWAPDGRLLAQTEGAENALVIATKTGTAWSAEIVKM